MSARRRPAPLRQRANGLAAETLGLRLVRVERQPLTLGRVMGQMLGGLVRQRDVAPFKIEVVELSTERVLAEVPVNAAESHAQTQMAAMRNELDTLDAPAFLRRWRRRP
jgi:hypothetical protein